MVSVIIFLLVISTELNNRLKCALRVRNMSPGLGLPTGSVILLFSIQIAGVLLVIFSSIAGVSFIISSNATREVMLNATACCFILELDNLLLTSFMCITDTKVDEDFWTLSVPLIKTRRRSRRREREFRVVLMNLIMSVIAGVGASPFFLARNEKGDFDRWYWIQIALLVLLVNVTFFVFINLK
eukprot:GHVR01012792.1.p1 GENE.GHVR01012792.1~~GHVR01012792.1.p1  ORF type:complete len:184 (+),score=31.26 GHVR01012792.1:211-762(+)